MHPTIIWATQYGGEGIRVCFSLGISVIGDNHRFKRILGLTQVLNVWKALETPEDKIWSRTRQREKEFQKKRKHKKARSSHLSQSKTSNNDIAIPSTRRIEIIFKG